MYSRVQVTLSRQSLHYLSIGDKIFIIIFSLYDSFMILFINICLLCTIVGWHDQYCDLVYCYNIVIVPYFNNNANILILNSRLFIAPRAFKISQSIKF